MDIRLLIIQIAEKIGLVATAALVSVLVPPLRNRLLGIGGQPRDRVVAMVLGFLLSMWGAKMGEWWLGIHVNVHAIGILMAAVLGGARVGAITGLLGGLFYTYRVEPTLGVHGVEPILGAIGVAVGTFQGWLAGVTAERAPHLFQGWRTFGTASAIQLLMLVALTVALSIRGDVAPFLHGWPALGVQIVGNSAGITIFVVVARVVLSREEGAVALVEAKAAADQLALEALRRRLEPHFLFNALNTLRATIRVDPRRARELVSDLSDLYRYLLNHPQDAPLQSEVEHACAYLAIERARLGEERLRVETDIAPETKTLQVPALLLQPLVENAVKHGVGAHDGEGIVRVIARRQEDTLRIEVEDHCTGTHIGTLEDGTGIALDTLRQRLAHRFPEASITLVPTDHGMRACVTFPWSELVDSDPSHDGPSDDPSARDAA